MKSRGGGIRTPDPLLPKQMRYQAALRPDSSSIIPQCMAMPAIGGDTLIVRTAGHLVAVAAGK